MATLKKNEHYLFMGAQVTPLLLSDETNGEITFHFEDKTEEVKAGDTIFIPKQTMHTFQLKTNTATAIFAVTSTDYEAIAAQFSRPASDENELPNAMSPADQASNVIAFSANHGLTFQTHE